MKRTPATLNLQQKVKDKVFYQALELLHDQDPKSMDKLNELIEENLKVRNSKPRNVPTARTEKPSFLRSFSRDQPRNALKNKPAAPAWTPTTKLVSPSSLKTMRREPQGSSDDVSAVQEANEDLEAFTEELEAGFQVEEEYGAGVVGGQQLEEDSNGKRKFGDMQGAAMDSPQPDVKMEALDSAKRAKLTKSDEGFGSGLHNKRKQNINKKLKEVKKRREVRMSRFG